MGRNRGKQNGKAPAKAPTAGKPASGADGAASTVQESAGTGTATAQGNQPDGNAATTAPDSGNGTVGGVENKGVSDGQTAQAKPDDQQAGAAQGAGDPDGQASGGEPAVSDHSYALMFKSPLGIAELAAGIAASARFFADGALGEPDFFDREEATIMADFVRANPDAPVLAMFNQLTLVKRLDRIPPTRDDEFVLSLFHATVKAAHQLEADRAAEAAKQPAPSGTWPGEQSLKPSEPAFSPTGFSLR